MEFFVPPDISDAHDRWGANCGPCAIAAAFGLSLAAVEVAVSKQGRYPGYMGIPDIRRACKALGRSFSKTASTPGPIGYWPPTGTHIAMINIDGPWRRHHRIQAMHRHIVAARYDQNSATVRVYDANAEFWIPARAWIDLVMTPLATDHDIASTGEWSFSWRGTLASPAAPLER